ncbi:MAG: peptide chain release factor N(5)-glutamine methyltransferase [Bacteroidales bacterium]|nr:peptide chain release factor N(5)-glutamine methyltransferase [Bacteroidales bacterium]
MGLPSDFISLDRYCRKRLAGLYDASETGALLNILYGEYLNISRAKRLTEPGIPVETVKAKQILNAVGQLERFVPVQYILGKAWFYGMEFEVNPDVLIPRPETEELVEWVAGDLEKASSPVILDIGTGSGCIAIALKKKLPGSVVMGSDVSEAALSVAAGNVDKHKVEVELVHHNILLGKNIREGLHLDVLVCNPPYVRMSEKSEMKRNVLDYEPHPALFVSDENPLMFYNAVFQWGKSHLRENGVYYFEINQYLVGEIMQLCSEYGFSKCLIRKDIKGNFRMMRVSVN